jgi:hypothetical protein
VDDTKFDQDAMKRLAGALAFICGADHPTTLAVKAAAESGVDRDIKAAYGKFLKLKGSERRAAMSMIAD